jgi:DNA repair protein RadA/Sms
MSKPKLAYVCQACGAQAPRWSGQCGQCNAWNSVIEEARIQVTPVRGSRRGYAAATKPVPQRLADVSVEVQSRMHTGQGELDRVLGGGLVPGSVVLIGGDPGIGKSTLLLQSLCFLNQEQSVLYVTGEESLQQVRLRAERLSLQADNLLLLAETEIESILEAAEKLKPKVMVIDSIQTMYTGQLSSAPGSVGQVREAAALLVQYAKQTGTACFLVGHVTKEGALAGPRVLEHMVDAVLYFEGERDNRYRMIRAVKNRFGAVNELGLFTMTDKGLREVNNPSRIFLSRELNQVPGSVVLVTWEGSRPLLVEVQALVADSHLANPRRVTVGLEQNRLAMLLAVLHRHGSIATYDQDVFANVVGGVRVTETGADLALLFAVFSSLRNKPLPEDLIVFGEVGLAGEIRPVQSGQERLREAAKHGFKQAIVPKANLAKQGVPGMEIIGVQSLQQALSAENLR